MHGLLDLSYLVLEASDLAAWGKFSTEIVGMHLVRRTDADLYLRVDQQDYRLHITQGPADDLRVLGWNVGSHGALAEYVRMLSDAGLGVQDGGPELARQRQVEAVYFVQDPTGYRHEFTYGARTALATEPYSEPFLRGGGFKAEKLGLGHVALIAKDRDESCKFYTDVLGLQVSDYIRDEVAPDTIVDVAFFHTATGRHHSLATTVLPVPRLLDHLMVEYLAMADVGLAYDRCKRAGVPISVELGQHTNDKMFSFYATTPSGFSIELGYGGVVIDDPEWSVTSYPKISDWGHQFNRTLS